MALLKMNGDFYIQSADENIVEPGKQKDVKEAVPPKSMFTLDPFIIWNGFFRY